MAPQTVEAAVMAAPRKMETREFPVPKADGDSAVVRMLASGICGTDKHMYHGGTSLGLPGAVVSYPVIPGHENLGVIEEIGERAARRMAIGQEPLVEGERVVISADIVCGECYYCRNIYGYPWCSNHSSYGDVISCEKPPHLFGGWAEKMFVLPGTFMAKVPKDMPDEVAVLTEQMAVAYGAFGRATSSTNSKEGYSPSDTVVVQGVGPLGMCNALMAKMLGAGKIIAIDKSEYRLELAKELCADEVVNVAHHPGREERVSKVLELTGGLGADVVVECTGARDILGEGLDMLRLGGTYLVEGAFVDEGETQISPSRHIVFKNARIIGVAGMPFQAYERALVMMESYRRLIPFEKMVTHRFGVRSAEKALLTSIEPNSMKVVVAPSED